MAEDCSGGVGCSDGEAAAADNGSDGVGCSDGEAAAADDGGGGVGCSDSIGEVAVMACMAWVAQHKRLWCAAVVHGGCGSGAWGTVGRESTQELQKTL